MRAVSELNRQNAQLQEELKRTKNDLKVANIQVDDLKKVLEELSNEMRSKVTIHFYFHYPVSCDCVFCRSKNTFKNLCYMYMCVCVIITFAI